MTLTTPVEKITRVGKSTASRLHRLGIYTAKDLLFHIPNRYEDWTNASKIESISGIGNYTVTGVIASIKSFRSPRRKMHLTEAIIEDETGSIKVMWFNQPYLAKNLAIGTKLSISGKTKISGKEIIMQSPKYEVLYENKEQIYTNRLLPVYPLALNLTQKQVQFLVSQVLPLADFVDDPMPDYLLEQQDLPGLSSTLKYLHAPESVDQVQRAQIRLAFEELFYLQLQSATLRDQNETQSANSLEFFEQEVREFVSSLPFELTDDQKKTTYQIFLDTNKDQPMNRLVQGDVGSGKTVVAAIAAYNTSLNGLQTVLMAPTEVLAKQHFHNFVELFKEHKLPISLFTRTYQLTAQKGKVQTGTKSNLLEDIKKGRTGIVIGTHALIQPDVKFKQIGLAIIDEQHRFGVNQRKTLKEADGKQQTPHLLSMTATPIPRTLTLVLYGDLTISNIRQKPKDRLEIKTHLVKEDARKQAYAFIKEQIGEGRQAFVVCPLIEESDKLGVTSVSEEVVKLRKIFPEFRIEILHGKLDPVEKDKLMQEFAESRIDILVATTVIEVGVDVPNATIMLIEGAERFGLSQLHQIRGRVGRGKHQSYCFLFPTEGTFEGFQRLKKFIACKDGFEVSELDLQLRGGGNVLGTKQSGVIELKYVDITDREFIENVTKLTQSFLSQYSLSDFPKLESKISELNQVVHLE